MELPLRWRVFEAVARRLSFSKAAEELFISQPAVTRHIKDLEQELGMTLFERNGNRGIDLTAQGHGFKAFMGNVNLLKQDLETSFHISGMQWEGDLAIGASSTVGLYVLPPLLAILKISCMPSKVTGLRSPSWKGWTETHCSIMKISSRTK